MEENQTNKIIAMRYVIYRECLGDLKVITDKWVKELMLTTCYCNDTFPFDCQYILQRI